MIEYLGNNFLTSYSLFLNHRMVKVVNLFVLSTDFAEECWPEIVIFREKNAHKIPSFAAPPNSEKVTPHILCVYSHSLLQNK